MQNKNGDEEIENPESYFSLVSKGRLFILGYLLILSFELYYWVSCKREEEARIVTCLMWQSLMTQEQEQGNKDG